MSLLTPAIFNSDDEENLISKKKGFHSNSSQHNKTLKKYHDTDKVSAMLKKIHSDTDDPADYDEDNSGLADFNPPPPATSIGSVRSMERENMQNLRTTGIDSKIITPVSVPVPVAVETNDTYELNNFKLNYGNNDTNDEYYKRYIPNYKGMDTATYNQNNQNNHNNQNNTDVLLTKLNYMIHLLEEKKDERTNNVTEEVVLYSFLGVFIIFIVDSFSRIGKYVR
jgi:hypothetical protein